MESVKADEFGLGTLDFDKVIPTPDNIYQGILGAEEMKKYGSNNWYDWNIANWGTKWNSYGYDDAEENNLAGENIITFNTAWSAPHPVVEKLSKMFPDVNIVHKWADEDLGNNCGEYEYFDGERIREHFPETYKEGIDFACKMWGYEPVDIHLVENALGNDYVSTCHDEFEVIELLGQKALFSNSRLTKADIPKGMNVYHLRENDEGNICSVEPQVLVNHAGSVITKEPIDFKGTDHIPLTEDTSPNFLGETATFGEFMDPADECEDMEVTQ